MTTPIQPPRYTPAPRLEALPAEEAKPRGRRPKRKFPPLPLECFEGMSVVEKEHYDYFIDTIQTENPDLTPFDAIPVHLAGLEYINVLRTMADQLKTGQIISMARQHPAVQLRAWIDLLSVSRKQRKPANKEQDAEAEKWMKGFTGLG